MISAFLKKKKKALPGCLSNTQASNKRVLYETDHNIRYKQHKIKKSWRGFWWGPFLPIWILLYIGLYVAFLLFVRGFL